MGIDLASIEHDVATTVVHYSGMEAKVEYRPSVLTPAGVAKFQQSTDFDEVAAFICGTETQDGLVVSWDITRGKRKVPVTADGMSGIPLSLLQAIAFGCMEDQGHGERGNKSGR